MISSGELGVLTGFILGGISVTVFNYMNIRGFISGLFKTHKHIKTIDSNDFKMVLVVRTDLSMGKGKIAAQCCHATLGSFKKAERSVPIYVEKWMHQGQPKIVVKLEKDEDEASLYLLEQKAKELNVPCTVVHDAGHTQVRRGTATCAGFGPAPKSLLDQITGDLKLL